MPFFYRIRGEKTRGGKADNIPDNNLNKFKRTFTISGRQHLKSNAQLTVSTSPDW